MQLFAKRDLHEDVLKKLGNQVLNKLSALEDEEQYWLEPLCQLYIGAHDTCNFIKYQVLMMLIKNAKSIQVMCIFFFEYVVK